MRRSLWIVFATVVSVLLGVVPPGQSQVIERELHATGVQKFPIAIGGFASFSMNGEDLGKAGATVLANDLKFTTVFDVMEAAILPFDPATIQPDQERAAVPGLAALKIKHLAVGYVSSRGREAILEGRLFDVATGSMVFGKRYVGDAKFYRLIVHRFADDIMFNVTGEKGVAQTRIAYVAQTGRASKEIFVMDYDGVNPTPLTGNQSINVSPRWSPDGRLLAYTSYRNGNPDLFVLNFDSGRRDAVSSQRGLNITPAWSPDGQWLAVAMSASGGTNLFLVPKTGGTPKALTTGPSISLSPSFSPNGRQIAFNSDRGGTPQVYVMDVDGSNVRRLTFQGTYNASPRWSPRGEKIAFMCQSGGNQICLISPEGSGLQQLTSVGRNEEPTWSPDGRHLAFTSTRTGRREVFVMHADGTEQRRLTNNGQESYLADWSP